MKQIIIIVCLSFIFQRVDATAPALISKADALKFTTVEQALNLPPGYKVVECGVMLCYKDGSIFVFPGNTDMMQWVRSILNGVRTGDKLIFEKILLSKGTRNIKLEDKVYQFL